MNQKLIIFASGRGSNAKAIIDFFLLKGQQPVSLIISDKSQAPVLTMAASYKIPTLVINQQDMSQNDFLERLKQIKPDFIILAGFLKKIPQAMVHLFPNQIINIHPALLPKYGGRGMYGHHVHNAVIESKDPQSGITIHYVNEFYDKGAPILQATCSITKEDTPTTLAQKVHQLEHFYFPRCIEFLLKR